MRWGAELCAADQEGKAHKELVMAGLGNPPLAEADSEEDSDECGNPR